LGDEWNGPDMTRQLKMKANVFDPGSFKSRRALAYLIIDALNSVCATSCICAPTVDVPGSTIVHESASGFIEDGGK
jgi:hypothetical protein